MAGDASEVHVPSSSRNGALCMQLWLVIGYTYIEQELVAGLGQWSCCVLWLMTSCAHKQPLRTYLVINS